MTKSIIAILCLLTIGNSLAQKKCGLFSRLLFGADKYESETVQERMAENLKRARAPSVFSPKNDAIVSYLQFISRAFPHTSRYWPTKGGNLVQQGRSVFKSQYKEGPDWAIKLFGKAIEEGGDSKLVFQAYKYRGLARSMRRNAHGAIEDFDKAAEIGSSEGLGEVYLFRAVTKVLLSDNAGIIEDLSKVIPTDDPRFAVAYYLRAPHYIAEGKIGKAIDDYTQLLKIHPQDALAHFQVAKLHTLLRHPEAMEHYRAALKGGLGKEYNVHLFHGYALSLHGFLDESLKHLNRAVELSPKDARGLYLRSFIKKALNHNEEAQADLNTALLLNPSIGEWSLPTDDQFLNFLEL